MDKTEPTLVQQLAKAVTTFQLQQTGRAPSDVTVVIGEDTVVVTLHEALSPAEQALARTERVRQHLAQTLRTRCKPPFTASFGVAHVATAPTTELLVRCADDALYAAKAEGRDRAVLAGTLPTVEAMPTRNASEQRAKVDMQMMAEAQ